MEPISCSNLLLNVGADPRQLVVAKLYSFHGCMFVEDLFEQARPMRPYIGGVFKDVRAVELFLDHREMRFDPNSL